MQINFDHSITRTLADTHVPPQVSSFFSVSLISKNQSAALRQCQSTCVHTVLIRARGIDTDKLSHTHKHTHTYIFRNTFPDPPACQTGGNLAGTPDPASDRER